MSHDEWDAFGSDTEDEDDSQEPISISQVGGTQKHTSITSSSNSPSLPNNTWNKQKLDPIVASSLGKLVDQSVLHITQHFIKSNRTISLNQRVFGMIVRDDSTPSVVPSMAPTIESYGDDDALQNLAITDLWSSLFSTRILQRGVDMLCYPPVVDQTVDDRGVSGGKSYSYDGIALYRSFRHDTTSETEAKAKASGNATTSSKDVSSPKALHVPLPLTQQNFQHESKLRNRLVPGGFVIVSMSVYTPEDSEWTTLQLLSQWTHPSGDPVFSEAVWNLEHAAVVTSCSLPPSSVHGENRTNCSIKLYSIFLAKRRCTVNTASCRWKGQGKNKRVPSSFQNVDDYLASSSSSSSETREETWIQYERRILEDASIPRTIAERHPLSRCRSQRPVPEISKENIAKAVQSLKTHGFVVIPGLFDRTYTETWSDAVLSDFKTACDELLRKHNVDVINPGREGRSDPLSYREMAMREDLRVDLRDGPNMQVLRKCENENEGKLLDTLGYTCMERGRGTSPTVIGPNDDQEYCNVQRDSRQQNQSLRFNNSLLKIAEALCNPGEPSGNIDNSNPPLYKGNFGRWNFQGSGPNGKPQPLRVGQVGAVVSLPGSADQAIHADCSHLFEIYDCLPCHYVNAFIMGGSSEHNNEEIVDMDGNNTGENLVGGTAFVHGSHRLSVTARLTAENDTKIDEVWASAAKKDEQDEMHMRVIRPSLQQGDVLMFDCRTLHFGLANQSESGFQRPMLYVNMTHSWFNDPKNWDDRKSIF